ncbi:chloramphenicol acetyltransferase [Sphingobacterium chuzhouense]|uniref:Chloramphenicol acetyltransferase n=1 Tax=Sphingobacterium chuzhouense TaxID=1742264 RepID=A0ABR7XUB3_9SPHI|nr:chloramphenicol acetyltransferase [Sphingobacterium chuzhouense]MBD1422638.1 chloramphenicol acetyltransferase [Sphingobacterium chuzhouense]
MKTLIDIEQWNRKEHFLFFSQFEEPFFGVTVNIDCTQAYKTAKQKGNSFFLYYLFRALKTANEIENFRYRIIDKQLYLFDRINASPTINRPNGTFGFAYMDYYQDENDFYAGALKEIERVQQSNDLIPAVSGESVIHFSAIPWIDFTALSHARCFSYPDSSPKISFGKVIENNGRKTMPVCVHGHHGLMDGYHVGLFVDRFQELMNEE